MVVFTSLEWAIYDQLQAEQDIKYIETREHAIKLLEAVAELDESQKELRKSIKCDFYRYLRKNEDRWYGNEF